MRSRSVLQIMLGSAILLVPTVAFAKDGPGKPDKVAPGKPDKVVTAQANKVAAPKEDKVNICHITGNGTYRLINVNKSAEPAHVAHGDALPGSLVADKFVADDCTVMDTSRVTSSALAFGPLGWGGWSCPAGTTVVGGGYEPAEATVLVSEPAKPGSASGLYPVYPHYAFADGETGWVVQNSNTAQTLTVYAICVAAN